MRQGTLESCWITPISRFTILTGRVFMNFFWMIVFNLFTGVGIYLIFKPSWHLDWFALLLIFTLTMLSNYAFGLLMGGITFVFKEMWSFRDIFTSVLWILSGATFPVEMLPTWAQSLSSFVPYYYSLRDFRAVVLSGAALPELTGDLTFLLLFAVVSLLTSYALFKRMERVALRAGTLGLY
jgi:ABC-2 type transport system permease protein